MKKIFVKWAFTNDYGMAYEEDAHLKMVDTMEDAEKFIADKKEKNGGYFHVFKIFEEEVEAYNRMKELEKELAELKARF